MEKTVYLSGLGFVDVLYSAIPEYEKLENDTSCYQHFFVPIGAMSPSKEGKVLLYVRRPERNAIILAEWKDDSYVIVDDISFGDILSWTSCLEEEDACN